MKRVCSVLLICTLLMAGLTSFASAAPASLAISVDQASYNEGDTVIATVQLNDYTVGSWSGMTIAVVYDPEVLQYVNAVNKFSTEYTGGLQASNDAVSGVLGLTWVGNALPAPGEGNAVAELTFTVKETSESSVYLTAYFLDDGMALQGEKPSMLNFDGEDLIYSEDEILSDPITIQTEGSEDPEVTTPNKQTIETNQAPDNVAKFDVSATHANGGTVDRYKVDVNWSSEFTFTEAANEWIAGEHRWNPIGTEETKAKWDGTGTIELNNHSSKAVTATFKYTPDGNDTVMQFKQGETVIGEEGISIAAPQETGENEPTSAPGHAEVTAAITSGTITGENGATVKLGKLVVTIA